MQDDSLKEAGFLLLRPFTDDLDEGWKVLRAIALLSLVMTFVVWIFASIASPQQYARAILILNLTGWFTLTTFVFAYLLLCVECNARQKWAWEERQRKIRQF